MELPVTVTLIANELSLIDVVIMNTKGINNDRSEAVHRVHLI